LIAQSAAVGATPDALTLLFDQSDIQFPIYRDDPHDSDNENTMASALLQVGSNVVEWQVHTAKSAEPVFKLMNGAQK
jgi:hypothetical protein